MTMAIDITLFRNFVEDRRTSMEVYADSISTAISGRFGDQCHISEYAPRLPRGLSCDKWSMRVARYCVYSWQSVRQQGDISHILDHSYAHLLYFLNPRRTIVTVHDLIPLVWWRGEIPGMVPGRKPWLNLFSFSALRRAAHLLADSENTRQDLIRCCRCSPDKISVVALGVDPIFRPYSRGEKQRAVQSLGLDDGAKRILVIGASAYKNLGGSLQAVARFRKEFAQPVQLVKAGSVDSEWSRQVDQLGLQDVVVSLNVTRAQLPDVYNAADCLLAPSFYEGFGLPPLEAMACGTPVVTSNAGSLPEVVGDAALLCDPLDYDGLAGAMCRILTDWSLRECLVKRGLTRASEFTWEKTARQTWQVYQRVASAG